MKAFFCVNFFSGFRNFLLCVTSLFIFVFDNIANFYKFCYIYQNVFDLLSENLFYAYLDGIGVRVYLFSIFVTNEIFKILLTKRNLIRYYYFINIYIVDQTRAFILMKFVFFNLVSSNSIIF